MMPKKINKLLLLISFLSLCSYQEIVSQNKILQVINVKNANEIRDFFQYTGNDVPIISGHRGQKTTGFAENSIEALEEVLRYTPAVFEVDPRLTKDSVIVLMHDATLERTTNGRGKVSDYTLAELKKLRLKDLQGKITNHQIPTLKEAIEWSRGKTILNLDKKDVPIALMAQKLEEYDKETVVMVTVHNAEQAIYYHNKNKNRMFSAFIKNEDDFRKFENSGVPWSQMIAYIGPRIKKEDNRIYKLLNAKGVMCMISAASTYDKLNEPSEREKAYKDIIKDGASIIESDYPIEVYKAINSMIPENSAKDKYFRIAE
ncbi:glycerophosphodiester phosphodiesterase family protein [Arenibacter latericius]|uniref:glycerophosphodiester phosphodiesterase family protein n=1 Tax=Arenibacter latericius TaxID=86104 RepID=UPI000409D480|nr:glycerophosphodiester phosphodiesterase family protein [Arenibacter latericius]